MQTFTEFNQMRDPEFLEALNIVAEMMIIRDDDILVEEVLDEGKMDDIANKVKALFTKHGIKAHKTKGLIDYISEYGLAMGQMIIAGIKGDIKTVKKIANTEITKEEMMKLIHSIDLVALAWLTPILHFIEGATGWHFSLKPVEKPKTVQTFKDVIEFMRNKLANIVDTVVAKKMQKELNNIENILTPQFLNA